MDIMNKELEQQVFEIISQAGDAKSDVMYSLKKIKKGDYDSARALLKEASCKLESASEIHLKILSQAMKNQNVPTNFLLVHAEDHFSNASFAHSLVSELIDIFEVMDKRK
ncbi:PTS lactose/cellobiose transporter subunit IIA [Clostridium sp. JN-9]|uniref:PTS lactose/cellobiose transporter subunit IIA n=1 Tax=Clostridium sp. JN-9 TaxID=2507159 RepID=UPI001FAAFD85|nr:PTS lactose/cellobiose transporter subunit IIA [Clostridium sp. JN-9]